MDELEARQYARSDEEGELEGREARTGHVKGELSGELPGELSAERTTTTSRPLSTFLLLLLAILAALTTRGEPSWAWRACDDDDGRRSAPAAGALELPGTMALRVPG